MISCRPVWVVVAGAGIFATRNWNDVTIRLVCNLQATSSFRRILRPSCRLPAPSDPARANLGFAAQARAREPAGRDTGRAQPSFLLMTRSWRTSPIYVAIDTPDLDRAPAIVGAVQRHAGG